MVDINSFLFYERDEELELTEHQRDNLKRRLRYICHIFLDEYRSSDCDASYLLGYRDALSDLACAFECQRIGKVEDEQYTLDS